MNKSCTHTFHTPTAPNAPRGNCKIQQIFDLHSQVCGAEFPPLPHDEAGECIFHSPNETWKRVNDGGLWTTRLFRALHDLNLRYTEEASIQTLFPKGAVDLREITWIGLYVSKILSKSDDHMEACIDISGHRLDYLKIWLIHGVWLDELSSELTFWDSLFFANSTFHKEVRFSQCQFYSVGFHACTLEKNFLMQDTHHTSFMTFSHSIAKGDFNLIQNEFDAEVSITYSRFEGFSLAEFCSTFKKYIDFTASEFHTMAKITFCTFEQEVTFLDTIFHRRAFFQGNIFKGSAVFKREKAETPLFQEVVDFQVKPNEVEGNIIFERVSFLNINEADRKNLIALSQQNKVVIGPGCIKYRMQSPEFRIDTTIDKHNIILAWARVFTEFIKHKFNFNIGVEVKENHSSHVTFFYFSDSDIDSDFWESAFSKGQRDFLQLEYDPGQSQEAIAGIVIDKLAVQLKITIKIQLGTWSLHDTLNLLNTLTTEKYPEKAAETLHLILMDRQGLTLISGDAYTYQGPTYVQEATAPGSKNIVVGNNSGTIQASRSPEDNHKSD